MFRKLSKRTEEQLNDYQYSVTETSFLGLRAGALIQLDYGNTSRLGLVVSSRRTNSGYFLSTKKNILLNVVEVDQLTEGMFSLMINNLYRNASACNYHSPRILGAFLGNDNFKTFNVSKITNILRINIGKMG